VIRLIAAGLALLGLAAACGGNSEEAAPPGTTASYTGAADAPSAKPFPPAVRSAPKQTKVLVTVVDGDTHSRVRGARVVIGKRGDYANTRGLASVKIKRRTALPVHVSKPGYGAKVVRLPFKRKRQVTVRLYRDALQWTMYGATMALCRLMPKPSRRRRRSGDPNHVPGCWPHRKSGIALHRRARSR